jgi:tRNA A-37 threonylcarbamoyl transferase component Bud32
MSLTSSAPKLSIEHHRTSSGVRVSLAGVIDESFDRLKFSEGLANQVVMLDLGEVHRITSYGVREWVGAVGALEVAYLGFTHCRPALVSHLNTVPGFSGRGQLLSFYLPYACTACAHTFEWLIDLRTHPLGAGLQVPSMSCPKCNGPSELDDLPESYLSFAASQAPLKPPASFASILNSPPIQGPAPGLRVTKVVEGKWTGLWLHGFLDGRDHLKRAAEDVDGPLLISMRDVRHFNAAGLTRTVEFLERLELPAVLDHLPLELAERLALPGSKTLSEISVRSLRAGYRCPVHGEVTLTVAPDAVVALGLQCDYCGETVVPAFNPALAYSLRGLKVAPASAGLDALVLAAGFPNDRTPTSPTLIRPLKSGELILGRYALQKVIATGGMAEVFLARQTGAGGFEKLVVVKRILPHLADDETFVGMFLSEARIAARINHPNVVQILDVGRDGSRYFIIMEYVLGNDLHSLLKRAAQLKVPCPLGVGAQIVASMAQGLQAAHANCDDAGRARPIIHRDVSPHNVLVSNSGHVKLTDFGIAKAADSLTTTPTHAVKGKTPYLAPELIQSGTDFATTAQIDIYAAGLVLYQALTGVHPFRRETDHLTINSILNDPVAPPSTVRAGIPSGLDAIVIRAIDRDPDRRFRSARELATALEGFIATAGLQGGTEPIAQWVQAVGASAQAPSPSAPSRATPKGGHDLG